MRAGQRAGAGVIDAHCAGFIRDALEVGAQHAVIARIVEQEYECSFAVARAGAIYAKQLEDARNARRINADVVAILREPAIANRILAMGAVPDPMTPEEYASFIRSEIATFREVARAANVRLEG